MDRLGRRFSFDYFAHPTEQRQLAIVPNKQQQLGEDEDENDNYQCERNGEEGATTGDTLQGKSYPKIMFFHLQYVHYHLIYYNFDQNHEKPSNYLAASIV